jgi:hypothetical protein
MRLPDNATGLDDGGQLHIRLGPNTPIRVNGSVAGMDQRLPNEESIRVMKK